MALPLIVAALLGKAVVTKVAAGKVAGAGAKAASAGAKAAGHHHAQGGVAREVIGKVKDQVEDAAKDKAKEKAKGWWNKRKQKGAD
jgi:hypothetical protein